MPSLRALILTLCIVGLITILATNIFWDGMEGGIRASAPERTGTVTLDIPPGTGAAAALAILRAKGLASEGNLLDAYVGTIRRPKPLVPGEYAIGPSAGLLEELQQFERGDVVTYTFAIPAGAESPAVISLLAGKELADGKKLNALIRDQEFVSSFGLEGKSLDGYLFPDVYDLPKGLTEREVLATIVKRFQRATQNVEIAPQGTSRYDVLKVASLIERSAVPIAERRFYAALIYARLDRKMALEHAASDSYGLARFPIDEPTPRDLKQDPWNTTYRGGLPRTPIGSPSLDAYQAAANPAPKAVLYMVPRPDGTFVYCEDLGCFYGASRKFGVKLPRRLPRRFP